MSKEMKVQLTFSDEGPHDTKLFPLSVKAIGELVRKLEDIAQEVKKPEVKEVANFLLDNICLRIIEQQEDSKLFMQDYALGLKRQSYQPKLPVAFFIERVALLANGFEDPKQSAIFMRNRDRTDNGLGNFIGMRDPASYSLLFQAIHLLHEAKHAFDFENNLDYNSWSYNERELPAHMIEVAIMSHYGGRKLRKLSEYINQKMGCHSVQDVLDECVARHSDRLDVIFGKAVSDMEKTFRMDRLIFGIIHNIK